MDKELKEHLDKLDRKPSFLVTWAMFTALFGSIMVLSLVFEKLIIKQSDRIIQACQQK